MQIFAGTSNPVLAREIAESSGYDLGSLELDRFANEETRIRVTEPKVNQRVAVLQSLSTPTNDNLIEFVLICDALRREGASEIVGIIPWMGYSRQDKVFRRGEPLSAKVVAQVLQTAKLTKIITMDLHNRATLGFFDVPVVELSAKPLLREYFQQRTTGPAIVAAPDEGAAKATTEFADEMGLPVVYLDKKRDLRTGKVKVMGMSRSVKGADIIIVDDNVFTGSTLLATADELKRAGAKSIRVGLTHHLFVPGVQEKLETSAIDEIIVTDTVARPKEVKISRGKGKLKVLSVASIVATELTR